MDERFEDPSDEGKEENTITDEETMGTSVESKEDELEAAAATKNPSD
ncbi:MAG: hypothetical protein RI568_01775 [Natronomonas sp.]|jgi:hypothetical protein|nr:hypothetical protein [Natronomonas sp.]MDR9429423.1 hypothetical protein [Natronomonas sp.]